MPSPIVHFQFAAADPAAARAFFESVFGWQFTGGGSGLAASIETGDPGDIPVGGSIMQLPEGMTPFVTLFVRVDDLAATLATAIEHGGTVLVERTETPAGVTIAILQAPTGHVVGLVQQ